MCIIGTVENNKVEVNMKTILSYMYCIAIGVILALVYIYRTGGF